jgi:predicted nucleic acid-binding protein
VARLVLLDSGPLGLASGQPGKPQVLAFDAWLIAVESSGADVAIPEIADYEVRRELMRVGATAGLRRLDGLQARYLYFPLTTGALRRAAEFWADVRRKGIPTASPDSLDADCIIAGQAAAVGGPGDVVTVATTNVIHLSRFAGVDARVWSTIL